jgi:hypothetical protein
MYFSNLSRAVLTISLLLNTSGNGVANGLALTTGAGAAICSAAGVKRVTITLPTKDLLVVTLVVTEVLIKGSRTFT